MKLLKRASIGSPEREKGAARALKGDGSEITRHQLETILENISIAESRDITVCQDTSVPIYFVRAERNWPAGNEIVEAIKRVRHKGTKLIPLGESVNRPLKIWIL